MKKIMNVFFFLIISAFLLIACEEEETDNVSFVTTYPVISLQGDVIVATPMGTSYIEPGVSASVGQQDIALVTQGSIDTSTPGVYPLQYTATNGDGFSRVASRQVVVYDPVTDLVDLSGKYVRAATGVTVTVTKTGPSTYHINDAGGLGDDFLDVTFVHVQGNELVIPQQVAPSSGITVESVEGTAYITDTGFTWVLKASSTYGSAVRKFTKI